MMHKSLLTLALVVGGLGEVARPAERRQTPDHNIGLMPADNPAAPGFGMPGAGISVPRNPVPLHPQQNFPTDRPPVAAAMPDQVLTVTMDRPPAVVAPVMMADDTPTEAPEEEQPVSTEAPDESADEVNVDATVAPDEAEEQQEPTVPPGYEEVAQPPVIPSFMLGTEQWSSTWQFQLPDRPQPQQEPQGPQGLFPPQGPQGPFSQGPQVQPQGPFPQGPQVQPQGPFPHWPAPVHQQQVGFPVRSTKPIPFTPQDKPVGPFVGTEGKGDDCDDDDQEGMSLNDRRLFVSLLGEKLLKEEVQLAQMTRPRGFRDRMMPPNNFFIPQLPPFIPPFPMNAPIPFGGGQSFGDQFNNANGYGFNPITPPTDPLVMLLLRGADPLPNLVMMIQGLGSSR